MHSTRSMLLGSFLKISFLLAFILTVWDDTFVLNNMPAFVPCYADEFLEFGDSIINRAHSGKGSRGISNIRYLRHFGIDQFLTAEVWDTIFVKRSTKISTTLRIQPYHLLWALLFLKIYATESVLATMTGSDEKTFRKYVWNILEIICASRFEFVSIESKM